MSKISAFTGYSGQLWLDYELGHAASYTYTWESHTVTFSVHGFSVTTEFELTEDEQVQLTKCLAKKDPTLPPHWKSLSPDLHRLVERMTDQIMDGAKQADVCLRKLPKGLRLAPLKFRKRRTNANQIYPVIRWQFSEIERNRLMPIFEPLGSAAVNVYKSGLDIPMPIHFERRQVFLTEEEVQKVSNYLIEDSLPQPFRTLYSIALDNFINRSYESAIMILATSIETALKWWLIEKGDPISEYLITNIQSPPIDKLYSCARKNTEIKLPKYFGSWLVQLRNSRNDIAHRPINKDIHPLEVARWFAVGEAILGAFEGIIIEPMVGFIVEPIGEKANEKFPPDSIGLVLRRETLYKENSYHVVLDTGETWRFGENAFKKSENQSF